jgi:hypothetical protein
MRDVEPGREEIAEFRTSGRLDECPNVRALFHGGDPGRTHRECGGKQKG